MNEEQIRKTFIGLVGDPNRFVAKHAGLLTLAVIIADSTDRLLGEWGDDRKGIPGDGLAGIIAEIREK